MSSLKQTKILLLLFALVVNGTVTASTSAQTTPVGQASSAVVTGERISRIENGLVIYPTRIKGDTLGRGSVVERMKFHNVPGVSVAVINDGKIEWARSYGVREAGTTLPVTVDTLFQAASISKPIAAMAALKLVEDGKLSLDEDVNQKLVSWKMPESEFTKTEKVTLRRLLSHSAGLSVSGFPGYKSDVKPLPTLQQILDGTAPSNTKAVRPVEAPGTKWAYSGGGITLAQLLMMDVTGKPFPKLMEDIVLKKLDMKHSTYEQPLPADKQTFAARAHNLKGEKIAGEWHAYPEQAAAGLWTTPSDIARFAIELQQAYAGKSKKVISPAMAKQMLTLQKGTWGLGLNVVGEGESFRFTHGGSNEGFRCILIAYANGKGAVVMTNGDNGGAVGNEILRAIAIEYGWPDFLPAERTAIKIDPKNFAPLVGDYDRGNNVKFTISVEDGKLMLKLSASKSEMFAESENKFFTRERPGDITFIKNADGVVTEMVIEQGGGQQPVRLRKL